jgi:hypothetical protein
MHDVHVSVEIIDFIERITCLFREIGEDESTKRHGYNNVRIVQETQPLSVPRRVSSNDNPGCKR